MMFFLIGAGRKTCCPYFDNRKGDKISNSSQKCINFTQNYTNAMKCDKILDINKQRGKENE